MQNLNVEKAVLCACLEAPEIFVQLVPFLDAEDFADKGHRSLWRGFQVLFEERERPDAVRVMEMVRKGVIECSEEYIQELRNYLPSIGEFSTQGAERWAEKVRERAQLRRIRSSLNDVLRASEDPDTPVGDVLSQVMEAVVSQRSAEGDWFPFLSEGLESFNALWEAWKAGRTDDKVPTGFTALDKALGGGLAKGKLTVVSGRPGSFKTALAWLVLKNVAEKIQGGCVAMVSLEMDREDLIQRGACAEARVDSRMLTELSPEQQRRFEKAKDYVAGLPIRVECRPMSTSKLNYALFRLMTREDVKLLVIDYVELLSDVGDSEGDRVIRIYKTLREIAKAHNIPVVALSQVNRETERTLSRIPGQENIRWGGEQIADTILSCYYPYSYVERGQPIQVPDGFGFEAYADGESLASRRMKDLANRRKFYLIITKGRFSGSAVVPLDVVPEYTLIQNKAEAGSSGVRLSGKDRASGERDF